nr:spore cortex biosynthesis protein YabQ [Lysinibacillus fusiformis]
MVLSGIAVGFIIDSIRLIVFSTPKRSSLRKWMMVVELIAWILLGGLTYYLLFWLKDGAWRAYDPLAQIAGIFLYQTFFQTFLRFVARILVNITWRPFWFIVRFIVTVIRQILQLFINIVMFVIRPFVKIYSYLSYTFLKKLRYLKYNKKQQ